MNRVIFNKNWLQVLKEYAYFALHFRILPFISSSYSTTVYTMKCTHSTRQFVQYSLLISGEEYLISLYVLLPSSSQILCQNGKLLLIQFYRIRCELFMSYYYIKYTFTNIYCLLSSKCLKAEVLVQFCLIDSSPITLFNQHKISIIPYLAKLINTIVLRSICS